MRTVQYRTTGAWLERHSVDFLRWITEFLAIETRIEFVNIKHKTAKQKILPCCKGNKKINKSFLQSLQNPHHLPEKGSYPFTDGMGRKTESLPQIIFFYGRYPMLCLLPSLKSGVFFDVTGSFAPCYSQSPPPADFTPPWFSWT